MTVDGSARLTTAPEGESVSVQLRDARSVLARLWDDTRRYPDLEWVRTELDDALTILGEVQTAIVSSA